MARAEFFATWTAHDPVAVTVPETHPKNKTRPAQGPFFYERLTTFNRK